MKTQAIYRLRSGLFRVTTNELLVIESKIPRINDMQYKCATRRILCALFLVCFRIHVPFHQAHCIIMPVTRNVPKLNMIIVIAKDRQRYLHVKKGQEDNAMQSRASLDR